MRVHARRHDTSTLSSRLVFAWTTFPVACEHALSHVKYHGTSQAWHFTREEHGIMRTRVKCHGTCVVCVSCVWHIAHKWNVEL